MDLFFSPLPWSMAFATWPCHSSSHQRVSSSPLKFRLGYMTCFGQYSESWVSISAQSSILRGSRIAPCAPRPLPLSGKGMTALINWPWEDDVEHSLPRSRSPSQTQPREMPPSPPTKAWAIQLIFRRVNDRRFLHAAEVLGLLYIFTVTKLNPCTWLSPIQQGWGWVGISSIFSLLSSFQTFTIFSSNSSDHHVHILLLSLIVRHTFSLPFSTSTFLFFIPLFSF